MSLVTLDEKLEFTGLPSPTSVVEIEESPPLADINPDDELVDKALKGQTNCFELLVEKYFSRVSRIARHFFRSPELAEDIIQDTFAKAYFSLHTYRQGASFEHWLARIAVNNCYDELRRKKKRNEVYISDMAEEDANWLDTKLSESVSQILITPEEEKVASAVAERLLAGLDAEERVILTLLHIQDYSVKEIAQMLGWSEAKVKIRAFRARHSLRRSMNRMALTEQRLSKKMRT